MKTEKHHFPRIVKIKRGIYTCEGTERGKKLFSSSVISGRAEESMRLEDGVTKLPESQSGQWPNFSPLPSASSLWAFWFLTRFRSRLETSCPVLGHVARTRAMGCNGLRWDSAENIYEVSSWNTNFIHCAECYFLKERCME